MPPRGEDLFQQVFANTNKLNQHFKNVGLRKVEFKRAKSVLIEKELQVHFKHENEQKKLEEQARRPASVAASRDRPSSPKASPKTGSASGSRQGSLMGYSASEGSLPRRSMSSPAAGFFQAGFDVRPPSTPVRTRFGASYPAPCHPPEHPGAFTRPTTSPARSLLLQRPRTPAFSESAPPRFPGRSGSKEASVITIEPALSDAADAGDASKVRQRARTESSSLSNPSAQERPMSHQMVTPKRPLSPSSAIKSRQKPSFLFTDLIEPDSTVEDPLWGADGSREEELFAAADIEAEAVLESAERGGLLRRPLDPPDMIERLGDLMALLGPRYRTLPKEEIWEKAVIGGTTALQRREKRLGRAAARSLCDMHKRKQGRLKQTALVEDMLDLDQDGVARSAWLSARKLDREKARAAGSGAQMRQVKS
eukprot:TRINITY_DN24040_c1_g1_i1.p1 TRINITY_DN24040_c1_g1~~TRINITY_DN24040_c1_g1_i1.p1  ORF type:complete len:423 (+),score=87.20 TRINITY_DN24040_c1_g1_i1:79-1347(+)